MVKISTYITEKQKKWLDDNSDTIAKVKKGEGIGQAEHIRNALEDYIKKNGGYKIGYK